MKSMRWRMFEAAASLAACGIDALGSMDVSGVSRALPDGVPGSSSPDGSSADTDVAIDPNAPDLEDLVSIDTSQSGGAGGIRNVAPTTPGTVDNAGGGGGAIGRIWLRTRGTPATVAGSAVVPD